MLDTKRCRDCGRDLPLGEFSPTKAYADGRSAACKDCAAAYCRTRYAEGAISQRLSAKREWHLHKKYGISELEYAKLLVAQDGVCAICERPETQKAKSGKVRQLCVDHDHETGEIRGLLCCRCNRAIGQLGDTHEQVSRVLNYLRSGAFADS